MKVRTRKEAKKAKQKVARFRAQHPEIYEKLGLSMEEEKKKNCWTQLEVLQNGLKSDKEARLSLMAAPYFTPYLMNIENLLKRKTVILKDSQVVDFLAKKSFEESKVV